MSQQISQLALQELPALQSSQHASGDVFEAESSNDSNANEIIDAQNSNELNKEPFHSAEMPDIKQEFKISDSAYDTDSTYSIEHTEGEINFIPQLIQLTQFPRTLEQTLKQKELLQEFKKASEHYKKQAGIAITPKQRTFKPCAEPSADIDRLKTDSSQTAGFSTEYTETKAAHKRKIGKNGGSAVKTPLLHNLLTGGDVDKHSSKRTQSITRQHGDNLDINNILIDENSVHSKPTLDNLEKNKDDNQSGKADTSLTKGENEVVNSIVTALF